MSLLLWVLACLLAGLDLGYNLLGLDGELLLGSSRSFGSFELLLGSLLGLCGLALLCQSSGLVPSFSSQPVSSCS